MDTAAQTGSRELTAIMVVIASWILYRYVAPKEWREWSRAGLVRAVRAVPGCPDGREGEPASGSSGRNRGMSRQPQGGRR